MLTINRLFCFRLHTAGVVVGWIGGAFALLKMILYTILIARIDDLIKAINENNSDQKMDLEAMKTSLLIVLSVYLFSNVIHFMASILLVAGTMKERHLMIVPWLVNYGLYLFFSLVGFVVLLLVLIGGNVPFGSVLLFVILSGFALAFEYLIFTAIYSLFKVIQASAEQQRLIPNKAGPAFPSYTRI